MQSRKAGVAPYADILNALRLSIDVVTHIFIAGCENARRWKRYMRRCWDWKISRYTKNYDSTLGAGMRRTWPDDVGPRDCETATCRERLRCFVNVHNQILYVCRRACSLSGGRWCKKASKFGIRVLYWSSACNL